MTQTLINLFWPSTCLMLITFIMSLFRALERDTFPSPREGWRIVVYSINPKKLLWYLPLHLSMLLFSVSLAVCLLN